MTATLTDPRPSAAMTAPSGGRRHRLAGLERPLLLAGLALVALHLLDLAFSGPATSFLGVPTHPAAYERRTTAFLDRALGLKETS